MSVYISIYSDVNDMPKSCHAFLSRWYPATLGCTRNTSINTSCKKDLKVKFLIIESGSHQHETSPPVPKTVFGHRQQKIWSLKDVLHLPYQHMKHFEPVSVIPDQHRYSIRPRIFEHPNPPSHPKPDSTRRPAYAKRFPKLLAKHPGCDSGSNNRGVNGWYRDHETPIKTMTCTQTKQKISKNGL